MKPNGPHRYYRCHAVLPMHLRAEKLRCSQPAARADELDDLVWAEVVRHLRRPELMVRACTDIANDNDPRSGAGRQLSELRGQLRRLVDAYQAGAIALADLETRQRPLNERMAELEWIAAQEQNQRFTRADLKKRVEEFSRKVTARLEEMSFAERQELLRLVLDRVVITEARVELSFKIPLPAKECQSRRLGSGGLRSRCLHARETGLHHTAGPAAGVAVVDLGGEHLGQIGPVGVALAGGHLGQAGGLVAHGGLVQDPTGGADGGLGGSVGEPVHRATPSSSS